MPILGAARDLLLKRDVLAIQGGEAFSSLGAALDAPVERAPLLQPALRRPSGAGRRSDAVAVRERAGRLDAPRPGCSSSTRMWSRLSRARFPFEMSAASGRPIPPGMRRSRRECGTIVDAMT